MGLATWHSGQVVETGSRVGKKGGRPVFEFRVDYDSGRSRWHTYDDTDWSELQVDEVVSKASKKRPLLSNAGEAEERWEDAHGSGRTLGSHALLLWNVGWRAIGNRWIEVALRCLQ